MFRMQELPRVAGVMIKSDRGAGGVDTLVSLISILSRYPLWHLQ